MKTPPFLISASLLVWGWQTSWIFLACILIALLESARWVPLRWEFSDADINRVSDLCTIGLAMTVILIFNVDARYFILRTLQWLPVIIFPLILIQLYSRSESTRVSALLILLRRRTIGYRWHDLSVDLTYPYFCTCIISAAAANGPRNQFYLALFVLLAWALWPSRAKRFSIVVWVLIITAGGAVGFAAQSGLYRLQSYMIARFFEQWGRDDNPFKRVTAIGDIGTLKQSNRIVFRVSPADHLSLPFLLREACYTAYSNTKWYATLSGFERITPQPDGTTWLLGPPEQTSRTIQIAMALRHGKNLLKLPAGTFRLSNLDVPTLEQNGLGAVRSQGDAGLTLFQATYGLGHTIIRPPEATDLNIAEEERETIMAVAQRLRLNALSDNAAVTALRTFFLQHFSYSLDLSGSGSGINTTDVGRFLLHTHSGHCEYFATATILLLRAAGIPARYVSGYMASEYSSLEDMILVRERHAHAWALAYVDGQWIDVDTTPPDWISIESRDSSVLTKVSDFFSYIRFAFSRWRHEMTKEQLRNYLTVPLIILMILFVRRLWGKKDMKRVKKVKRTHEHILEPSLGSVSEFVAIEKWLNDRGFKKAPAETVLQWVQRIDASAPDMKFKRRLQPLVLLHYRSRYSANGLSTAQQQQLTDGVGAFLGLTQK